VRGQRLAALSAWCFDVVSCLKPVVPLTVHRTVRWARPPLCSEGELFGLFWIVSWRIQSCAQVRRLLQRTISNGPSSFVCGASVGDVFPLQSWSGFYLLQNGPMSVSFSCSFLRSSGTHSAAGRAEITRTCFMSTRNSTLWQCVHSSWQGRLERASAFLFFRPWRCSEAKMYSCWRWTERAVCPSMFEAHEPG
jgi:hypothetical protein